MMETITEIENQFKLFHSTYCSLYVEMFFNELLLASGTAFLVKYNKKTFVFTARHNVTGRNHYTGECLHKQRSIPNLMKVYFLNDQEAFFPVNILLYKDGDTNSEKTWLEHPVLQEKADFVAFPLPHHPKIIPFRYDLENFKEVHIIPSYAVSVVGFPFGKSINGFPIWNTGFLATEMKLDYQNQPVFLIDCRTRPSQSGSPVICPSTGIRVEDVYEDSIDIINRIWGNSSILFGIYSGRINKDSDLGIVWKVSSMIELLNRPYFCLT